jgi:hypothetical protein
MRKKYFIRLFRIDAKRRNLKRNDNETKRKQDKKKQKLPPFSLRSEMKRNRSEIVFASMRKKCFFASEAKENEMKQKLNEKEAKTSKRKRI